MFVRTTIFTITVIDPNAPAPAPAPSPTPDVLPATGAIITPAVILGTMTLLLGVAMIFTRRRLRK
jgi:LPXTG-motif cell wall-anchored protein